MNWLTGTFYLHPIPVAFAVIAVYVSFIVALSRKNTEAAHTAAAALGLKPASTNMLVHYLNKTSCPCMNGAFDGTRAMEPVIADVFMGTYAGYAVSLFSLTLPTGRTGTPANGGATALGGELSAPVLPPRRSSWQAAVGDVPLRSRGCSHRCG
jgi:hypothetical protein